VRSPRRARALEEVNNQVRLSLRDITGNASDSPEAMAQRLLESIKEYDKSDAPNDLGALKQFKMPPAGEDRERAAVRFKNEIDALKMMDGDPAVVGALEFDHDEYWLITDFQQRGSLSRHPDLFKGNVLGALQALRPIIAALAKLHQHGIVHRDIKPHNIFLGRNNQLVLGDFGIVFFENGQRATELLERVGSRDWMAPWAHTGLRVDDVKQNFDIFPLGKVLWSMISGRSMLPFWYHLRPEYDLTVMFPDDPAMYAANQILGRCIVEHAADCLSSAADLLLTVDAIIKMLSRGGQLLGKSVPRPCRMCGMGQYQLAADRFPLVGSPDWDVFACDYCDHIQFFGRTKPWRDGPPKGS
jgi:serine/threonine protein kinase